MKHKLFMCHKDKKELKGTNALEYIKWGETQGFHKRPSCSGRARWWAANLENANSLFVKEANDTSAVFYNPEKYPIDCRLYCADLPQITFIYLNSPIAAMMFEIYNRAGLGEGARSLMVSDYSEVPCLYNTGSEKNTQSIIKGISCLAPRKLTLIKDPAWFELDEVIFESLALTQNERDAVYEAVINLVESRLKKAESVKT